MKTDPSVDWPLLSKRKHPKISYDFDKMARHKDDGGELDDVDVEEEEFKDFDLMTFATEQRESIIAERKEVVNNIISEVVTKMDENTYEKIKKYAHQIQPTEEE